MLQLFRLRFSSAFLLLTRAFAQTPPPAAAPTRADILRGEYGPYRANNDLLSYHLDVRVDPEKKFLSGKNTIRFKMLQDGTRIQLDLQEPLKVDRVLVGDTVLKYEREAAAVFIDFPRRFAPAGRSGRFGGITFRKDPSGHTWINTACEGQGADVWWPNWCSTDQQLQRIPEHWKLRALRGADRRSPARCLRAARESGEGQEAVCAGQGMIEASPEPDLNQVPAIERWGRAHPRKSTRRQCRVRAAPAA